MIHPVTCVCLLMAAGSGLYVYQSKHQAQMLDREITRTMKSVDTTRQRTGLMRAEYALLNDPSRLAELSSQNIASLKTSDSKQFTTWADLDRRLNTAGAVVGAAPPASAVHLDLPVKAEPIKPEPIAAPARPEAPKSEPPATRAAIATTTPPRPPAPAPAAPPASAPATAAAVVAAATPHVVPMGAPRQALAVNAPPPQSALPAPIQLAPPIMRNAAPQAPTPAPAPRPALASATGGPAPNPMVQNAVATRPARPAPAPVSNTPVPSTPAEAIAQIARGAPVDTTVPAVASALGMARAMMTAPSPVSSAYAAPGQTQSTSVLTRR